MAFSRRSSARTLPITNLPEKRKSRPRSRFVRLLLGTLLAITAALALFFYKFSLHIEIQKYNRGWVKENVLSLPPLSGTCFGRAASDPLYNKTLAHGPKYVNLHAGMSLALESDCYNFASTIPRSLPPGAQIPSNIIYHTFWKYGLRPITSRHIDLLHSILAFQKGTVFLWTNKEGVAPLAQRLDSISRLYGSNRFQIRLWDPHDLALGTYMDGSEFLDLNDDKAWVEGDLVRVLALWNFGGVWVDMDSVFLTRDWSVLFEHEWLVQWDCYDKKYLPLNGAFMHFFRHSPYLCEMLFLMRTEPAPRLNSVDWGAHLYHKLFRRLLNTGRKPFAILPYCFMDGRNCRLDNRLPDPFLPDPFPPDNGTRHPGNLHTRDAALKAKLSNIFAVHLHNQWPKSFPKGGWVHRHILTPLRERVRSIGGSEW